MKRFFVTGIDTNVGKTLCSAVLAEALHADYWKPIQTGIIDGRDLDEVEKLVENKKSKFFKELYTYGAPVSPHLAAAIEGDVIDVRKIRLPHTSNHIIIEGAGGILVPLNKNHFIIEIAKIVDAEVILVIRNYLGCINHSLLSISFLVANNYKIKGLILNGNFDPLVEEAIVNFSPIPVIARIPEVENITGELVSKLAQLVNKTILV